MGLINHTKPDPVMKAFDDIRMNGNKHPGFKSLPPAVKESLVVVLKETHKRYKKFGYNGYLGHVNIIAGHFHLTEGL